MEKKNEKIKYLVQNTAKWDKMANNSSSLAHLDL
jgi:hypothetical protein